MRSRLSRVTGVGAAAATLALVIGAGASVVSDESAAAAPTGDEKSSGAARSSMKGIDVKRGAARPTKDAAELGQPPVSTGRGPDAAVEGFADALVWGLASEAGAEDAQLVPDQLGGMLNAADASMLVGFDRSGDVALDLTHAAYRVLGYSGDEKNPNQVMVEVTVPLEVDGVTQRLVAGGVMVRTPDGWLATSLRPRDMDEKPQLMERDEVIAEVETGELGIGWETFAEAGA